MDKTERLLDAIEHHENYTDAEIEALLTDAELKTTLKILHATKSSLQKLSEPDVEAEWSTFDRKHRPHRFRILSLMSRNIAAAVIIGILSVAAVAAIVGVRVNYALKQDSASLHVNVSATDIKEVPAMPDTITDNLSTNHYQTAEIIIFDNESFETIANRIAEHYGYAIEFFSDDTKSLRLYFKWDPALPLEEVVISLNNFEQLTLTIEDKTIKIN